VFVQRKIIFPNASKLYYQLSRPAKDAMKWGKVASNQRVMSGEWEVGSGKKKRLAISK